MENDPIMMVLIHHVTAKQAYQISGTAESSLTAKKAFEEQAISSVKSNREAGMWFCEGKDQHIYTQTHLYIKMCVFHQTRNTISVAQLCSLCVAYCTIFPGVLQVHINMKDCHNTNEMN